VSDQLAPGVVVQGVEANYEILSKLGGGGFGTTWAARHVDGENDELVLKVLRLDRAGELKALELFEREAKVLAGLDHPRIPKTFEFFAWDGSMAHAPYSPPQVSEGSPPLRWVMVQARVSGSSLRERIRDKTRLRASEVTRLLRDGLELLDYLHGLNPPVVHRDIKPGNLILDEEGRAHLVDFGAIQDRLRRESTVGSTSVGTFGYLPMEQMMGQARAASDLYALGITVLVVASHREPEELPMDDATAKVDLSALSLALAPKTLAVLDRMIEPIVGQRIASARECLAILDGEVEAMVLRKGGESGLAPAVPKGTASVSKRDDLHRHGWLWKMTAGGGGLAAGFIYLVFFNSFSETELIQVSTLWLAPVAFGLAGHLAELNERPNPIALALLWAGLAVGALIFFIYGIFPGL
jgi:serine/threonine protein kinase